MAPSYTMKMEGVCFSETLQYIYKSTSHKPVTLTHYWHWYSYVSIYGYVSLQIASFYSTEIIRFSSGISVK
jgi:hypothetical protein